jgi:pyridoxal phosphate enzyme (YggS family)
MSVIDEIRQSGVKLVAVTKGRSLEQLMHLYERGQRDFGENRLPEAFEKMKNAPSDCRWHFIGSLQSNKVSKVVGEFSLIHSIDSLDLAKKISRASVNRHVETHVLLQVNTSQEASKHGMSPDELKGCFEEMIALPNLSVDGLMTMGPLSGDEARVRRCFAELKQLFDDLNRTLPRPMSELSMGMSQDYKIAIQEGATMVRIGSLLFNGEGHVAD